MQPRRSTGARRRAGRWPALSVYVVLLAVGDSLSTTAAHGAEGGAGGVSGRALNAGPYNASFLEGGVGVTRPLAVGGNLSAAGAPWSMIGWIRCVRQQSGAIVVAAVGEVANGNDASGDGASGNGGSGNGANGSAAVNWRGLVLVDGELELALTPGVALKSGMSLQPGRWYAVAATYDGTTARLYVDGSESAALRTSTVTVEPQIALGPVTASGPAASKPASAPKTATAPSTAAMPQAEVAPAPDAAAGHFGGSLAQFTLSPVADSPERIRALALAPPDFSLIDFDLVGAGWPWQQHAWRGLQEPQDPWTLPHGNSPPSPPHVGTAPAGIVTGGLQANGEGAQIQNWHLLPAPRVDAGGEQLSQPTYQERGWYPAVVPGTVLSTLIARGVYPDPDYGLNNLAIPESLSRQDYWYRSVFVAPQNFRDRDLTLTFKGINYAAEVWFNGRRLGTIRGAFTRGSFDVTGLLQPGETGAIAVRISPPPHPGIAHEQSMAAGPGENGGALAIDGPTFIATEGWDWIPAIRDRNAGIWQAVEIHAGGALHLGDPQVLTHLPLPRTDTADVTIVVPVENPHAGSIAGKVVARFDGISVEKAALFKPGRTEVELRAAEFPQLRLRAPRLWWPNGYGPASLHALRIDVQAGGALSDSTAVRFGIRELTYELSLFDHDGRLRRVEVDPAQGALRGERLIDVRHEAIKRTPQGWAASLTLAGENSPAVRPAASESLTPYLVIRVNGVAIAARGGSWGMDDSRKRIARERLEPYFRLQREAHLNIIRNWLGQNTEDVFYDLADENGLLVLNDFWVSTQDFQMEPQDPALFLANARDVISRYRNHPSIAVWFGRNEGVPQPIINEGLADLAATLDGTRYYTGSSNAINLQGSGPYNYRPPEQYFTELARGFSVEVGTPSLATLESLRASIPAADLWPLNDTYAYHDWHFGGNGDAATFMAALAEQYGPGTGLEDFERKAQLMNYVSYRAIFEGFQAHLWTRNSGRLLWMTHPSWPSNSWQIYSSDYDTGAAYYAVKKACEPLHAQLNLPDLAPAVINTTRTEQRNLVLHSRVLTLDNRLLQERSDRLDAPANATTLVAPLSGLSAALAREAVLLVKLTLTDGGGVPLSDNVYWQSDTPAGQRLLNRLAPQAIRMTARARRADAGTLVKVSLSNSGPAPVLNAKLTVLDDSGARVLPVYYSDNYVTLLAGESREIAIDCPASSARCARIALRGWNIAPGEVDIESEGR